jgi:hypothetical protein
MTFTFKIAFFKKKFFFVHLDPDPRSESEEDLINTGPDADPDP